MGEAANAHEVDQIIPHRRPEPLTVNAGALVQSYRPKMGTPPGTSRRRRSPRLSRPPEGVGRESRTRRTRQSPKPASRCVSILGRILSAEKRGDAPHTVGDSALWAPFRERRAVRSSQPTWRPGDADD
jgi:hypothetical protein